MADALIQSRRIYAPFVGGGGEVYLANLERETLMKRTFQQRFEAAARADGALPRVMLKLGGYHITRGASPTWVQGLGGFVSEYAVAHGVTATTISMWCGPGGAVYSTPEPVQCDESVAAYWPFLAGYVDRERVTIVDFRIWRLRPGRWEHLSADAQAMIGSYDVLVIVPNGPASPFLPELSARAVQ